MQTDLLYLQDLEISKSETKIISSSQVDGREYLILNQSPFYPKGGGQPSDKGKIFNEKNVFTVEEVLIQDGEVLHFGAYRNQSEKFMNGEEAQAEIDLQLRQLHSRIHSAGELIVAALVELGYDNSKFEKAIHYPENSSVEYSGIIEEDLIRSLEEELPQILSEAIKSGREVQIYNADYQQLKQECGYLPSYLSPEGSYRVVKVYGKYGRPCKGTHVRNLKEIGEIELRKIKVKKGNTVIAYRVV